MILATIGQIITQAQAEFESKRVAPSRAAEEAAPAEAPARRGRAGRAPFRKRAGLRRIRRVRREISGCAQPSTLNSSTDFIWLKLLLLTWANSAK